MFDRRNPHLSRRIRCGRIMVQHHVVGFGRAGSPYDVKRIAAKNSREPLASLVQRRIRACADAVRTGRIADEPVGGIKPCLASLGQQGRGGVMIEVSHHKCSPRASSNWRRKSLSSKSFSRYVCFMRQRSLGLAKGMGTPCTSIKSMYLAEA